MRRTLRFARLLPLVCALVLAQPASSSAYNKVESQCVWMVQWATDKLPVEVGHTERVDDTLRRAEGGPDARGHRYIEKHGLEEPQAPRGNHGQVSGIVYHLEYDPVITVWCQCPLSGDTDPMGTEE